MDIVSYRIVLAPGPLTGAIHDCKNNDPHGLSVCAHTIGYLPPELCGRALYICAMHGNALAGKEVLPYTTIEEKKKALFKAVELRHGDMITLILNDDKEKTLINHMLNAAGGGQVLLGHALELGAETGDCALTTAVLKHIYDGRVHAGPKFNDPRPKIDSFGRPISTYRTERAHLWCWPSILRAKNVATVRGWTSPPYFFTLAASPPITSKDMPSAVATRVHLTKHIIVDKSTELSQQERSQCYSRVYSTQHEHVLTIDTKTLT